MPETTMTLADTHISTWFERDRAYVGLLDSDDNAIVEWWDAEVSEAIEDGFLTRRNLHASAFEYAKDLELLPA